MNRYLVISISRPVEGREKEMNDWYDQRHVNDLLGVSGFGNPRRYRMCETQFLPGEPSHQYVAAFDLQTDDIGAVRTEIEERVRSGAMPISNAVGDVRVLVLEALPNRTGRE